MGIRVTLVCDGCGDEMRKQKPAPWDGPEQFPTEAAAKSEAERRNWLMVENANGGPYQHWFCTKECEARGRLPQRVGLVERLMPVETIPTLAYLKTALQENRLPKVYLGPMPDALGEMKVKEDIKYLTGKVPDEKET